MTLYEDYYTQYRAAVSRDVAKGKKTDYVVRDFMWITMKFLSDRNVEPWENEKMAAVLDELQAKGENKMLECMEQCFRAIP